MELTNCGYDFRHLSNFRIERPNGIKDYLLLIIRSPAFVCINGETHYTKGHSVIIFNKNTPQFFGAHNGEFINDFVQFDANEEDLAFLTEIGISFDTVMEFQYVYTLSTYVKQIFSERWSNNKNATKTIRFLIHLLLLKISDYYAAQPIINIHLTERLTILRNNIFSNPQNRWLVESLANSMSISPSYLHSRYKQLFGTSIKRDITFSRLEYSKYLLANTNHAVLDIAHMSGYENVEHYIRMFKKNAGCTPMQYRKSSTIHE